MDSRELTIRTGSLATTVEMKEKFEKLAEMLTNSVAAQFIETASFRKSERNDGIMLEIVMPVGSDPLKPMHVEIENIEEMPYEIMEAHAIIGMAQGLLTCTSEEIQKFQLPSIIADYLRQPKPRTGTVN